MLSGKRHPTDALTPSHEHYLRAIWDAKERTGYARVTDVASALGISHATLSAGLRSLQERGLVTHVPHRFLELTEAGSRAAREVHHRHSVTRRFLHEILGVDAETADREACLIEHDLGAQTTERLVDLIRLLHEDIGLRTALQGRLSHYHRSCSPSDECTTCGLGCLTPAPVA